MNWDIIEKEWAELKGQFKSTFPKITDRDMQKLSGRKDQVLGRIQQRYGIVRNEAEKRVTEWVDSLETAPLAGTSTAVTKTPHSDGPVETRQVESRFPEHASSQLGPDTGPSERSLNSR